MTIGERLLIAFTVIGVPIIMIGIPIYILTGGIRRFALKPLQRCFEGLNLHNSPRSDDVSFIYYTYRGFIFWISQDEHCIYAPPEDARILLKRLLYFNLTWGMFNYGLVFVPLFAVGNYWAQKRSLEKQEGDLLVPVFIVE